MQTNYENDRRCQPATSQHVMLPNLPYNIELTYLQNYNQEKG
jgi:hypothetical protein